MPLTPQILIEMIRAYCEVRDLDAAAHLVEGIELAATGDESLLTFMRHRARLVFLAYVGRTHAVERILAPTGPLAALPPASQFFWSGIARLNAGDRSGARAALERAARLSRGDRRAREVAELAIASIDMPGVAGPHTVAPHVAKLADRLTATAASQKSTSLAAVPQLDRLSWRRVPVTVSLIVASLLPCVLLLLLYGSAGDIGGLVRIGGNLPAAVWAGEWWRLATSSFLHAGFLHLFFDFYLLWMLGRLLEEMYGAARYLLVYLLAGLGGAIVSLHVAGGLTVGASAAALGLVGALLAELVIYRARYHKEWRRQKLRLLAVTAASQTALAFLYPLIAPLSLAAGLVIGGLLAAVLSPRAPTARLRVTTIAARFLAVLAVVAVVAGVALVVGTSHADRLARFQKLDRTLASGLVLTGPDAWQVSGDRWSDDSGLQGQLDVVSLDSADQRDLAEILVEQGRAAGFLPQTARPRPEHKYLSVPDPWLSRELQHTVDGVSGESRYRILLFARWADGALQPAASPGAGGATARREVWIAMIIVPEALAGDLAPTVAGALASVRRP